MNPVSTDQRPGEHYSGSEALDVALADRFGCIVDVPDWKDLDEADRQAIADPKAEGTKADDGGALKTALSEWSSTYAALRTNPPPHIAQYAERVVTLLDQGELRLSPRRARQLSRSLLGISALRGGEAEEEDVLLVLKHSIPHRAWGQSVAGEMLTGAHRIAWESSFATDRDRWINRFLSEPRLAGKVAQLLDAPDEDTASIVVARTIAMSTPEERAAFAFALYPAALEGKLPLGKEGVADLARIAGEIITVRGMLAWRERHNQTATLHPGMEQMAGLLLGLEGGRRERAVQLFHWCLVNKVRLANPSAYEGAFNEAVLVLRQHLEVAA
jgi:MoxR-like ATPase